MSKISPVRIGFLIATFGRSFRNFDKSQFRNVSTSSYVFSRFFIIFSFRDISCQKALRLGWVRLRWAGLGQAELGQGTSFAPLTRNKVYLFINYIPLCPRRCHDGPWTSRVQDGPATPGGSGPSTPHTRPSWCSGASTSRGMVRSGAFSCEK